MKVKWEDLTIEIQDKYILKADFLIDNKYANNKNAMELAKMIYDSRKISE
jgi:hypothetical protein